MSDVRPVIYEILGPGTPEGADLCLRGVLDWYRAVVDRMKGQNLSEAELAYIDQAWGGLVTQLAFKESVPAGWLSYSLAELARLERRLAETAQTEAEGVRENFGGVSK